MVILHVDRDGQVDMRDDAADHLSTASPSSSHHPKLYSPQQLAHPQQQQPMLTFDEWEAAIVKSISERPDDIIDIFERYAEEREEYHEQESLSYRREHSQVGLREDNNIMDESREEGRQEVESRENEWVVARESFVTGFVNEFRTKIAQLTYPSSPPLVAVSSSTEKKVCDGEVESASQNESEAIPLTEKKLQEALHAEELKSKSLALRLQENERRYERKLEEMWDRVQFLETQYGHTLDQDGSTSNEPSLEAHEESSHMESTLVTDFKAEEEETSRSDLEERITVLAKALEDLQRENETLKATQVSENERAQAQADAKVQRIEELEEDLESAQAEIGEMQRRWEELGAVLMQSDRILEWQRTKMQKMSQNLQHTTTLYEHERAARLSLERINEATQKILDKLHRKVAERQDDIDELTELLAQRDSMIQSTYGSNINEQSAKMQNMSSVMI